MIENIATIIAVDSAASTISEGEPTHSEAATTRHDGEHELGRSDERPAGVARRDAGAVGDRVRRHQRVDVAAVVEQQRRPGHQAREQREAECADLVDPLERADVAQRGRPEIQ